jgi:putative component of toxin-antitoxin plasmid stabilization module
MYHACSPPTCHPFCPLHSIMVSASDSALKAQRLATSGTATKSLRISGMQIHQRLRFRLYFTKRGKNIFVLLVGGDKNAQRGDVGVTMVSSDIQGGEFVFMHNTRTLREVIHFSPARGLLTDL